MCIHRCIYTHIYTSLGISVRLLYYVVSRFIYELKPFPQLLNLLQNILFAYKYVLMSSIKIAKRSLNDSPKTTKT